MNHKIPCSACLVYILEKLLRTIVNRESIIYICTTNVTSNRAIAANSCTVESREQLPSHRHQLLLFLRGSFVDHEQFLGVVVSQLKDRCLVCLLDVVVHTRFRSRSFVAQDAADGQLSPMGTRVLNQGVLPAPAR